MDLQSYFDKNFNKKDNLISFSGKNKQLEGSKLLIEDYKNLKILVIKGLPQLIHLEIKDCKGLENLKLYLDESVKVKLVGQFPKLKNWCINNTAKQPLIIKKKGCVNCKLVWTGLGVGLFWIISFTVYFLKELNKFKKKKNN